MEPAIIALIVVGNLILIFVPLVIFAMRFRRVGPNEALIISGPQRRFKNAQGKWQTRGFRICTGGGTFVWPVLEHAQILSLELMTVDIKVPDVPAANGQPVTVSGLAQIKIKSDLPSIATAAERFLSKSTAQLMHIAVEAIKGHLRAAVGRRSPEQILKEMEQICQEAREGAGADLARMGMEIDSFVLKDVQNPPKDDATDWKKVPDQRPD